MISGKASCSTLTRHFLPGSLNPPEDCAKICYGTHGTNGDMVSNLFVIKDTGTRVCYCVFDGDTKDGNMWTCQMWHPHDHFVYSYLRY